MASPAASTSCCDGAYREFIERRDGFRAEVERETAAARLTYAELEENDEALKRLRTWYAKIARLELPWSVARQGSTKALAGV